MDSDKIGFDATYVLYNKEDPVGAVLALASLAPQCLLIVYTTMIFSRREIETVMMLAGQVGCELVNEYLKRILKQERPKCMYD